MGRISARCRKWAMTAIVSFRSPDLSKITSETAFDLATTLPWPEASGAAARRASKRAAALRGASCAIALTFFMSAFAERPASASPDCLPALGATARGRAAARWLLDEASESE